MHGGSEGEQTVSDMEYEVLRERLLEWSLALCFRGGRRCKWHRPGRLHGISFMLWLPGSLSLS